jgi:hypothetical protein
MVHLIGIKQKLLILHDTKKKKANKKQKTVPCVAQSQVSR